MNVTVRLLRLLVILSPFTSWLALSGWLRLPVLLALFIVAINGIVLLNAIAGDLSTFFKDTEDILIVSFLFLVSASFALAGHGKAFSHMLSYYFTIIIFLFCLKYLFRFYKVEQDALLQWITTASVILIAVVIIEFVIVNAFDFQIRKYFVWTSDDTGVKSVIGGTNRSGVFTSASGPAEEPGSTAVFLNIYCPLALGFLYSKNRMRHFSLLLTGYIASLLFLTSAAGIAFMMIPGILVWLMLRSNVRQTLSKVFKYTMIFLVATAVFFQTPASKKAREYAILVQKLFLLKVSLDKKDTGTGFRLYTWRKALENSDSAPYLGLGPGTGSYLYKAGYHSVFLTILADIGRIAFLLFLTFLFIVAYKGLRNGKRMSPFFFWSIAAMFAHMNVVGDYFHLHLWLLIIVLQRSDDAHQLNGVSLIPE